MDVLLLALALQVLAGVASLCLSRSPCWATVVGAGGTVVASLLGLIATLPVLFGAAPESLYVFWDVPHGAFVVEVDALGSFFLLPIFVLSATAAIYGADYLFAYRHEKALGCPWFFFNVFVAGMAMVIIARTALLFLIAWEVMSLAAFCLVTFEHEKPEARRAGWIYLIATHVGAAFLIAAFLLLGRNAGSLEFEAFRSAASLGPLAAALIFCFALVGFGAKAGLVPLHVWLPEAHPAAPSHVSALMSGVMIKMGLYGILRVLTFLGPPHLWWGPLLAAVGLLTAMVGIALALYQRDIKRVLAYSSIENVGLIALALGVALWAEATDQPVIAALATTAALLHLWNHALLKGLMFFTAGSVLHATNTKDMERLGGLMKRMPWTGTSMMVGAMAIAALPPLNGFVGKWLIYQSLAKCALPPGDPRGWIALLAIGLLALIGAQAAIAYVRLTGIVLLGSPRSESARQAHESSAWMIGPIALLLIACVSAAVAPYLMVTAMSATLDQVLGVERGQGLLALEQSGVSLAFLGSVNVWVILAVAVSAGALLSLTRRAPRAKDATWGCGYLQPTSRMQYTGSSFSEAMAEHLLPRFLRPRLSRKPPEGLFPGKSQFISERPDPVTKRIYEPWFARWARRFSRLRVLQQGKVHVYLFYIILTVVAALGWLSLRTWRGMR
jgi:formate hydrogenlyase subunit 3/multisubunit Na+/H+ antiporter MnhD subunit